MMWFIAVKVIGCMLTAYAACVFFYNFNFKTTIFMCNVGFVGAVILLKARRVQMYADLTMTVTMLKCEAIESSQTHPSQSRDSPTVF